LLAQSAASPAADNAATPAGQTPPPVTFRTQANLVLVDVVVTGKEGSVSGLDQARFHLLEDGKPQRIMVFEEHKPDEVKVGKPPVQLPPHVYSNFPEFTVVGAANVLLLDALNTPLSAQMYVRQQMLKYLKNVPPGTRIAVFTLASRLRMVQGLTTDSTAIVDAISNNGTLPKDAGPAAEKGQQSEEQLKDRPNLEAWRNAITSLREFRDDTNPAAGELRVDMTLDALKELARYLSFVPGRKNLIWFAGSIPLVVDPVAALQSSGLAQRPYFEEARRTADMLTAARISVYPIDARMLMPFSGGGVGGVSGGGERLPGTLRMSQASGASIPPTIGRNTSGMFQIAEDTGGEAFVETNDLKSAVVQAIDHGSHYYTIGYTPTVDNYDGSFRHIRVEVDGYQAAYRRGYYADKVTTTAVNVEAETAMMDRASEYGAPPFSQILFQARVLPASDPAVKEAKLTPGPAGDRGKDLKGPVTRYLIDIAVDPHPFTFTATPDGIRHLHVETAVVAYDSRGKRINNVDRGMAYNLTAALYQQIMHSGLPIHQEIDLPPGASYLRIVVHDWGSTNVGSTLVPAMVASQ